MELIPTRIPEVVEIRPRKIVDDRGYFMEIFREDWFRSHVADVAFVQENQSFNHHAGLVRGIHYQQGPRAQGKLARCTTGAIFDVAVDLRTGSSTFGTWVAATLTADEGNLLWIPEGFGHGYCSLLPGTAMSYKVTDFYSAEHDGGVAWNDPEIGICWPDCVDTALLSQKDRIMPLLRDLPEVFDMTGTN